MELVLFCIRLAPKYLVRMLRLFSGAALTEGRRAANIYAFGKRCQLKIHAGSGVPLIAGPLPPDPAPHVGGGTEFPQAPLVRGEPPRQHECPT